MMLNFQKQTNGITLLALIITIIILIILAGVTISILAGKDGLFSKAKQAKEKYLISESQEKLELEMTSLKIEEESKGNNFTKETLLKLNSDSIEVKNIDKFPIKVTCNGYEFNIDENYVITYVEKIEEKPKNKYIKFKGSTYIDTGITEEQINADGEFTISTSVNISRENQSKIAHMDILGNHSGSIGLAWQFEGNSNYLLFFASYSNTIRIDYTPYYDKWTNIVMTYNQGEIKIYFNNELIATKSNSKLSPYGSFLIGSAYLSENRAIIGEMKPVRIWKKELQKEDIDKIDYIVKNTDVQIQYILKEINFDNIEELSNLMIGTNYEVIEIEI